MGDAGFLKAATSQYRSHVYLSDVVRLGGRVAAKEVDADGSHLVRLTTDMGAQPKGPGRDAGHRRDRAAVSHRARRRRSHHGDGTMSLRDDAPAAPLPLTGVRVLDLGHVFQGPCASFLLAMAGAEVIKIEPPRGDMSRQRARDGDYPFRALNGCKRGIVLNLKTQRGRELLIELGRTADVLVENFAPSVMPRLGLGPETFRKVNPRLISEGGRSKRGPGRRLHVRRPSLRGDRNGAL